METETKTVKCPYCFENLDGIPKRSQNCPHCGKKYFVRKGVVSTEEEASILDWLNRLSLTQDKFEKVRNQLSKEFGFQASINDTVWRLLNLRLSSRNSFERKTAFYEMARLARIEGKPTKQYIAQTKIIELQELKREGVKKVRIVGYGCRTDSPSVCPSCKALYGKVYTIDEAMNLLPVPTNCTNEECQCEYIDANRSIGG